MLKTGMIIAERYEIVSKIGTGGMADVYKAMDHKLNRNVAVKVLKPEFREDKTFIHKFKSEAQAAAGLTHPNIVNVYDVGDDEGVYYIVMELIEGITLKAYITKKGKLSIKEATSIAIQVSMGLDSAHKKGIVHRDVKPQNIIISRDGKVKVTDFGIARAASSNTISSNVMGSVHYSSPEQVRGGYSDEKSDIYSLGITIYEMVTGRVPFEGDTTVAIAIKHLQEEMVAPSEYAPELPFSLEQIIYKCTQKSVDRRYQDMEDVIADLKHSLVDPDGDFVKMNQVDPQAKTVVISDKELGEIKQTSKQTHREEIAELEKQLRAENQDEDDDYDDEYDEDYDDEQPERKQKKKKKRKSKSVLLPIIALVLGALVIIAVIVVVLQNLNITGNNNTSETPQVTTAAEEDDLVEVPDLVGKTESEAKEIANALNLGIQMMGEENSDQATGNISSQNPAAGSKVEPNSTLQYYLSKGAASSTIPDMSSMTAIDAEQTLKDMGLQVTTSKEYSELDEDGYAVVEPGYVLSVTPDVGTTVEGGTTVSLVVSRGADFGESAEVPDVVGMQKNEALTTLGKWIDIEIVEEESTEAAAGEVIAQSIEAGTLMDPDLPITITISKEETETSDTEDTAAAAETSSASSTSSETVDTAAAAAAGEVWKCNQRLNTPENYQNGPIRLQLVQEVNGESEATIILDGETVEFPYQLDITGTPGVSEGTLYLSELVDGAYQELGHYTISFEKVQ